MADQQQQQPAVEENKPTILLVDDSQFSLSQSMRALGDGFAIVTAASGAEGLVKLESTKVDLVVTDLLMPHISGLAFLGQVRQHFPNLKVIVCSADIQDATAEKAKALGAAAFIPKPVDPEEFTRVVRLVLAQDKAPSEIPINPRYVDAFKEIFNIGVGRAARALSKLVYETVKLSVPRLEILRPYGLANHICETFVGELACVRQDFSGTADGTAYLLLSEKSGLSLVNALVCGEEQANKSLTDTDREMLIEVGNILINSLVGTLANTLGIAFRLGRASCEIGRVSAISEHLKLNDAEYVLFVETLFVVPGRQIGGNLVILMGSAGMGTVLKGIDRVF
ncbi:MAG: response regulator [Pseudomonadota bacterium]